MQQLPVPFAEKLDEPLAQLCNNGRGLAPSERFPVVLRCDSGAMEYLAGRIEQLGGTVRHQLRIVSALAAWVPLNAIETLAQENCVVQMELVQTFKIADQP